MFDINGIEWDVKRVSISNPILQRSDLTTSVGVTDVLTKTIYLADDLLPAFERKVLCHEITHCAMFSYGVDLTLEQEELVADLISTYGDEIISITNDVFGRIKKRVA